MDNDQKPMTTKELTSAINMLLEREQARVTKENRRRRRRVRQRRAEMQASIDGLFQSVEIIKYCIIGITSVMAIALFVLVIVVWQIGNEAERIKGEVAEIRGEAEKIVQGIEKEADQIRDKIQHPLRSIGGALGGQLDQRLGTALGIDDE